MEDWTIKNSDSVIFKKLVIPYLENRFAKTLTSVANWYSVINGELVMSAERPAFVNSLGRGEFIKKIIYPREFKKGEKVVVRGREGDFKCVKYDLSDKPPMKVILVKNNAEKFWVSEFDVFQKPQKTKKTKKKKKFKNGEKVIVYQGGTREYTAHYVGRNPISEKGIHVVVYSEFGTRHVHEDFITKLNQK